MKVVLILLGFVLAAVVASKGPLQVKLHRGIPLLKPKPGRDQKEVTGPKALLPDDVNVVSYNVELTPILESPVVNPENFEINRVYGKVSIKVNAKVETVGEIRLNAYNMDVNLETITVTPEGMDTLAIESRTFDVDEEVIVITFDTGVTLPMTPVSDIVIEFVSNLYNSDEHPGHLYGAYRTSFRNKDGQESLMVVTHMEPTGARELFPCFDEPRFKAKFTLTVGHPATGGQPRYTVYSNSAVLTVTTGQTQIPGLLPEGWVQTIFHESPSMSTYLVSFVVALTADYGCVIPNPADPNMVVQVCGPAHLVNSVENGGRNGGAYPVTQTLEILQYFSEYTGIPYTENLDNMQSMAIPEFPPVGMENWGLNLYQ